AHRGPPPGGRGGRRRVLRRPAARPPRPAGTGDGLLPAQQRGDHGRCAGGAGRAGRRRRLRRPPRQRHPGRLLRRPAGHLRLAAPVAAVPRDGRAAGDRAGRGPRPQRQRPGAGGRDRRRLPGRRRRGRGAAGGGGRRHLAAGVGRVRRPPRRPADRPGVERGRLRRPDGRAGRARAPGAPARVPRGRLRPRRAGGLDRGGARRAGRRPPAHRGAHRWRAGQGRGHGRPDGPPAGGAGGRVAAKRSADDPAALGPARRRPHLSGTAPPSRAGVRDRAGTSLRCDRVIPERLKPILDDVRPLAERFTAVGHTVYLVGGIVRDLVLGRAADGADLDLTTDARPEQTRALLEGWADAVWDQGAAFGTIGARKGGTVFEITTHRAEAYREDSRKPHVVYSDDVTDDLSRRDFTVNAMALRVPDLELIDPYGGVDDLAAR